MMMERKITERALAVSAHVVGSCLLRKWRVWLVRKEWEHIALAYERAVQVTDAAEKDVLGNYGSDT